jgi:hypothetical protein
VHSAYTECCLTTVLGPTSTLLLRQLVFELLTGGAQGPHPVNLEEIGRSLGLGAGTSTNSKLGRALTRLGQFGYPSPSAERCRVTGCEPTSLRSANVS